MEGAQVQGRSARFWRTVTTAGAIAFFASLALAGVASATRPGYWNFSSHPAASVGVIAIMLIGIVVAFGAGFAAAAATNREAAYGYTTVPRLAVIGLELRSPDGQRTLAPAPPLHRLSGQRLAEIESARSRRAVSDPGPARDVGASANRRVPNKVAPVQIVWAATIIAAIAIGVGRVWIATQRGGPAALVDASLVVVVLAAVAVGAMVASRNASVGRARKLAASSPGALIIGTMRTLALQAAIARFSPGATLRYGLAIAVDSAGFHLWQGSEPTEVFRLAADSILDVTVDKRTQGSRSWDAVTLVVRNPSEEVVIIPLFVRRITTPWTLTSGPFVHAVAETMRAAWNMPQQSPN